MIQQWIDTDISECLSSDKNALPFITTQIMITNRSILKIDPIFLVYSRKNIKLNRPPKSRAGKYFPFSRLLDCCIQCVTKAES